ncbi:hypothetical protein [Joostella sp. CR20]|uniref:hypothetical protein n=1 Tax=Joostella sp. CR20 TaxID=2804312 RepID=UPI00313ACA78
MAPTIIIVIEENTDVAYFYNLEEEKKETKPTSEHKELKELPFPKEIHFNISQILTDKENFHYYNKYHYNQVIDVVIPPPEVS